MNGRTEPVKGERAWWLLPCLVSLAVLAVSVFCHHGGVLSRNMERRLPYYLSGGPLVAKVYDSNYAEDEIYQARELSYVFDDLDCRFISRCVAHGCPHFLSWMQYLCLFLVTLVFWQFGWRDLRLGPGVVLGVILLFWTAPNVFFSGNVSHMAKFGAALALVVLYRQIHLILRKTEERPGFVACLGCFGWAWLATLFDRQGVFIDFVMFIFLLFYFMGHRRENALRLAGSMVAALAANWICNHLAGPWITLSTNFYWPNFGYQQLPWGNLLGNPVYFATLALSVYLDVIRFMLGNVPAWCAGICILVVAVLAFACGRRGESNGFFSASFGLMLGQTFFAWVMIILMFMRDRTLVWPDMRRSPDFIPILALLGMTLLLTISRLQTWRILRNGWATVLLAAAVLGNIMALPRHEAIIAAGSLQNQRDSRVLLEALRNFKNPRYAAPREIAANPVFQYFHDGYFAKTPVYRPLRERKVGNLSVRE